MIGNFFYRVLIGCALSCLFIGSLCAQSAVENAKSFKLDGVYLGMPKTEFEALYPNAMHREADNPDQIKYLVSNTESTDFLSVEFSDEVIVGFLALYDKETVELMGFKRTFEGLSEKFGKPTKSNLVRAETNLSTDTFKVQEGAWYWVINDAHFGLSLTMGGEVGEGEIAIWVCDTRVYPWGGKSPGF